MIRKKLKIIYLGTPDFAVMPLRALVETGYDVAVVVTAPDKPAGRGLQVQESAVKRYAREAGLKILQPEKLKDPAFLQELEALEPDLGIVIAFRMLPEAVWRLPRLGTFNLHASLLPQYRGAAPIHWAVINGEKRTGVTTFMLNAEIDKGAILGQRETPIGKDETTGALHDRLMVLGTELVLESVEKISRGEALPVDQSTLETGRLKEAPKIFRETCRIDWQAPLERVYDLIRGLNPYPTAWSELKDEKGNVLNVKIFSAEKQRIAPGREPGTIVSDGRTFLDVACRDGFIRIGRLQLAGKRAMDAGDFLRGFDPAGFRFE